MSANWNYESPPGDKSIIYFDNIEYLDAVFDKNMHLKRAKVTGELLTNCNIAGTPTLKAHLSMTEEPDDLSLHRSTMHCLKSIKNGKPIEFTPPNGINCVLGYRYPRLDTATTCLRLCCLSKCIPACT